MNDRPPGVAAEIRTGKTRGVRDSIADTIGATPLVRLARLGRHAGVSAELLLKLESANPTGSIADRLALATVDALAAARDWDADVSTLVDVASRESSPSLAVVAAARGYGLILATGVDLPDATVEVLRRHGANLAQVDDDVIGSITARADTLAAMTPDRARVTDAAKAAATAAVAQALADEILTDTGGRIDVIVIGGEQPQLITECARRLLASATALVVVGVTSGDGSAPQQGPTEAGLLDEIIRVPDAMAGSIAALVANLEGLPVSRATGAALAAALTIAARPDMTGKAVITIACTSPDRAA